MSGVPIVKTGSAERTGFEIRPSERKSWGQGDQPSEGNQGGRFARIISCEGNVNVEHASFVNTTFRPGNARVPKEGLVGRDWTETYTTQVLFLEVRNLAVDALERCL